MAGIPEGWEERVSKRTGQKYYLNLFTKESQWDMPTHPATGSSDMVQVRHLLIKHSGSRNPISWRNPSNRIEMPKSEAIKILTDLRGQIERGEKGFEDLATERSDCSSAKRGGDLGLFGRNQMQKPFEDASYALSVGEMSGIVDTDSGVHIILRIA